MCQSCGNQAISKGFRIQDLFCWFYVVTNNAHTVITPEFPPGLSFKYMEAETEMVGVVPLRLYHHANEPRFFVAITFICKSCGYTYGKYRSPRSAVVQ